MTLFTSQGQAKRFFVQKIVAQATREGHPLSENAQWMLSWSESDPEFMATFDNARVSALAAEMSDEEYEAKVAGLAQRVCAREIASDPTALATYREAYRVLNEGDHYLSIILDRGLKKWLHPWWKFRW